MNRIDTVAIRANGYVYIDHNPSRHHNILQSYFEEHGEVLRGEQGFIHPVHKKFITRKEAAEYSLSYGHVTKLHAPPYLYSEDLW